MKSKEFLIEYKITSILEELKQRAIKQVIKIDDDYWRDKPKKLRNEYTLKNRLPLDHPFVIDYQKRTGRQFR